MSMICPHCKKEFAVDIYVGEESHDYNATLVRKRTQHINWSEIKSEIENGYGNAILSVGDKLCFTLKDGRDASVSVIAINHYENNSVIFMFDNMLWEKEMNHRSTNHGGWHASFMADFLDDEVYSVLPEELACVIKARTIVQKLDNVEYKRESKLWLPSMTEMFGERAGYDDCDFGDIQFPIFKKKELIALEQEKTVIHIGIGFALLILTRLTAFGWSMATATASGTTPLMRLAFAPASLSEISISSM